MKKWMGIVLALFLIAFQFIPSTFVAKAAPSGDVNIGRYRTSLGSKEIYPGDEFDLIIKLVQRSTEVSNITLSIDEEQVSPFIAIDGEQTKSVDNISKEITFKMKYIGGKTTRLPVTIRYTKDQEEGVTNANITINAIPDDTDTTPIDTSKYAPKLLVSNGPISSGKAGSSISIPLNIKNISSYEARNVIITPSFGETGDIPFEIDSLNLTQSISKIAGNKAESINLQFKIAGNIQEKTYPIGLNFNFENAYKNSYEYKTTIYVKVTNNDTAPRLTIKNLECTEMVIYPGGFTGVDIDILNEGTLMAKDVKVSILGLKDDGFSVIGGTNIKYISQIEGNQKNKVVFKLAVSDKLTNGSYGITVKLDYKDQWGKDYTDEQQFFIPVYSENTNVKTVPKIILEKYSCNPSIVRAGENFILNMSFINTSEAKGVRNIKIYLTVNEASNEGGNLFTPVNSSNTFFINSIEPKGKASQTLEFFTIPDAKAKTYTMIANFEYEDSDGNEYKSTELIGVPVQQKTRLETTEVSFPPEAYPGQPVPVGFDFYNMGKVTLSNLMIKLEGEFDAPNSNYFVGNFEPGGNDHYEGAITPRGPGVLNGAVVISYDDPAGQHVELKRDFSFNVVEMPQPQPGPGENPGVEPGAPKQGGFKKILKSPFTWIGLGVVVIAVVIFIRKAVIKKREGMTLDE